MKTNASANKQHRVLLGNPLRVHSSGNWQETDVVGWVEGLLRRTQEEILLRDGCHRPDGIDQSGTVRDVTPAVL